jgi:hypothetical protein
MPRVTIIVDVAHPEEVGSPEDWFAKWTPSLTFRSENKGVGAASTFGMWKALRRR